MLARQGVATVYTDSQITARNFNKGRRDLYENDNWDLWQKVFGAIRDKGLVIQLLWMPSHLKTQRHKERPDWVTQDHIEGNDLADQLATKSATDGQVEDTNVCRG